jgi:hypothetical protein
MCSTCGRSTAFPTRTATPPVLENADAGRSDAGESILVYAADPESQSLAVCPKPVRPVKVSRSKNPLDRG